MFRPNVTLMHLPSEQFENRRFFHGDDRDISPHVFSIFCIIEDTAHLRILFPPLVRDGEVYCFLYPVHFIVKCKQIGKIACLHPVRLTLCLWFPLNGFNTTSSSHPL